MSDDVPPELLAAAKARRLEVEAELAAVAAAKHDGVTRRSHLRGLPTSDLEALAAQHGVDLSAIAAREPTGCLVCDGSDTVDEAPIGIVALLCDEHADAVTRRVAERTLRPVIPADFHDARPEDLLPSLKHWTPEMGGLYFHGPVDTGKSHQAAIVTKRAWSWFYKRCKTGVLPTVVWRNSTTMMDDIAASWGTGKPYNMRPVAEAQLLILDDVGLADSMAFAVRKLYTLIEHRLHAKLCTIVTSNRNLDDLAAYLDSPQIASRLGQMCAQVDFEGMPNHRLDSAPRLE